jgi:chaperonin GroES
MFGSGICNRTIDASEWACPAKRLSKDVALSNPQSCRRLRRKHDNSLFLKEFRMALKIRPLHDRVVVKRLENETKTASGIVIPDNAAEKPDQGEVIAVGPGKRGDDGKLIAPDVKAGDRILFGKYAGSTVKIDGDEVLVLREEDILGVLA